MLQMGELGENGQLVILREPPSLYFVSYFFTHLEKVCHFLVEVILLAMIYYVITFFCQMAP